MSTNPPLTPLVNYNFAAEGAALAGGNVIAAEVVMPRDPLGSDVYPIGQLWFSTASSQLFVETAVSAGVATWSASAAAITTPVTVANGGTGRTTLLAHGVLVGEGTSAIAQLAVGTNGQVLIGATGADPAFATITSSDGSIVFTTGAHTLDMVASLTTDLASPPPIGNVAPNTGAFTTLSATGLSSLAALTQVGATNINASGAALTTIGTGGTGAVHIGNATGNTAVTGSLTASTGLVATTGGLTVSAGGAAITGTTTINNSGAAVTTIGTGGTGAVNIGNATGNTAVTGSLTASTTLTATLGAITATNGNLVFGTAGNKIISTSVGSTTAAGANSFGKVTLVGGTATVATTAVTANSIIYLTRQSVGATGAAALGSLSVGTITAGTSFVINAWSAADATALQASDVSVIGWMIVN